ncbi:MAG TPA: hypothetical protein VHB47_00955 [Thermoanaerobaculia bacterium]|jgi:plasmid stability protein|nr:hypothetical protein [Thermoanaerobaculia bacterium]
MHLARTNLDSYRGFMSVHLHIRDLPDEIHQLLQQRAAAHGLSLRQYALEVLREHCQQPTLEEWLDGLRQLTPVTTSTSPAEAIQEAREAEEVALVNVRSRS